MAAGAGRGGDRGRLSLTGDVSTDGTVLSGLLAPTGCTFRRPSSLVRSSSLLLRGGGEGGRGEVGSTTHVGNLVDSASSHTLVSKIKPCMSKYKRFIL